VRLQRGNGFSIDRAGKDVKLTSPTAWPSVRTIPCTNDGKLPRDGGHRPVNAARLFPQLERQKNASRSYNAASMPCNLQYPSANIGERQSAQSALESRHLTMHRNRSVKAVHDFGDMGPQVLDAAGTWLKAPWLARICCISGGPLSSEKNMIYRRLWLLFSRARANHTLASHGPPPAEYGASFRVGRPESWVGSRDRLSVDIRRRPKKNCLKRMPTLILCMPSSPHAV
jgi:hypothetical protein